MVIGTFNGFPVEFDAETEMTSCKGVVFSLAEAEAVSRGASIKLGTAKHTEITGNKIKVDCLSDSLDVFNQLIKTAKRCQKETK